MTKEHDENLDWIIDTGTIIYNPYRGTMKKNVGWWIVTPVSKEITRYYRWWVKNKYFVDLLPPSWDAHISIVRGEEPKDELKHLWKKHDHNKVKYTYQHNAYRTTSITTHQPTKFWVVDVKSEMMTSIRNEFGLRSNWDFHLTIGRMPY